MSARKRKAQERAARSQRTVSTLVLLALWMGMIVVLIIPARRESAEAKEIADAARSSLQSIQQSTTNRPKIAVTAAQQEALARAVPDRFTIGSVAEDLTARARALGVSVTAVNVVGQAQVDDELATYTVSASVSGPSRAVATLLGQLEANATLDQATGLVDVRNGMLLTLKSGKVRTRGDVSNAALTINAYALASAAANANAPAETPAPTAAAAATADTSQTAPTPASQPTNTVPGAAASAATAPAS